MPTTAPQPITADNANPRLIALLGGLLIALTVVTSHMAWDTGLGLLLLPLLTAYMLALPVRFFPVLVGFAYFYTANWQLAEVIAREDPGAIWLTRYLAPVAISLLQSLPLCLVRHDRSPARRFWRVVLAWTVAAVPPFGLVTWMHPGLMAGVLYPSMGAVGIPLALVIMAAPAAKLRRSAADVVVCGVIALALVVAGFAMRERLRAPIMPMMDWFGVNTQIPPAGRWTEDLIQPKVPGDVVAEAVTASLPAKVILFPETTFAPMSDADKVSVLGAMIAANKAGATVLAGASIATGPDSWRNTLVMLRPDLGDPIVLSDARVPMLYGNWQLTGGVPVHPFATDLVRVPTSGGPITAAVSICYEDILLWPHFGLLTGRSQVLLSLGNAWATAGTTGDRIQTQSATLLASMAGVPLVRARNEWHGEVHGRGVLK